MPRYIEIVIRLNKLLQCREMKDENPYTGIVQDGIFIPFDENPNIEILPSGNMRVRTTAFELEVPRGHMTHVLKKRLTKSEKKKMQPIIKHPPNVGYIKVYDVW